MIIKLSDKEIRQALTEAVASKFGYSFMPNPEDCWFECEAGEIEADKVSDIHNVKFCYDTD